MFGSSRALVLLAAATSLFSHVTCTSLPEFLTKRQVPKNPTGVKTITSPTGAKIRYKNPGKDGVCETTPGVNSYSGYIDLDNNTHMFFWFFEARHNPATAPLTLWLNGGPGSDSLIGLFQELGPCNVTADYQTQVNPYSWSEVSNLLFLSQPIGVGFSYATEEAGSIGDDDLTHPTPVTGEYPVTDPLRFDTTDLSAIGAWHVLQGFLSALPQLDSKLKSREFNLWTESYGGHYGPAFYNYFYNQNLAIANGTIKGVHLNFNTLGIGNGIYDEGIQAEYYPKFAVNNSYGIKAINDSIYNFAMTANIIPGGCQDSISSCAEYLEADLPYYDTYTACSSATSVCRNLVEGVYYDYSGRGTYDIRHPRRDPTPPTYFIKYLNTAKVQNALGVNINYTSDSSGAVGDGFYYTGDFVYPNFKTDLEVLLNEGVRVALYHGDADYICNVMGGEAVSLALNYTHAAQFRAAGYAPFVVNGKEYGEVRQYGNFSFLRVWEAGHEVPYYQPEASLEMFKRVLHNQVVADGSPLTPTYGSKGEPTATHTEPFVPLPSSTTRTSAASTATTTAGARPGSPNFEKVKRTQRRYARGMGRKQFEQRREIMKRGA